MDRIRYWFPVAAFLTLLVLIGFLGCAARADDFDAKIAALKAKIAAKKADPFAHANHAAPTGPRLGDQKITDDPSRPWTYGYGREYGYNELGWYRPLLTTSCIGGCPAGCNCPGTAGGPCTCHTAAPQPTYYSVPYSQPARSFAPTTFRSFGGGGMCVGSS